MTMGGGHGPQKISLSSPSGIIHGHLIVLVKHKQAQLRLQSDPKHYKWISTKFLKYFILANFLLPYSLIHCCIQSSVAENWLQLQLCNFGGNT